MKTLVFGTKAETLQRLQGELRSATLLPQCHFTWAEWEKESRAKLALAASLTTGPLVVRSSALGEDQKGQSQAGKYLTLAHIEGESALVQAIEAVFASYGEPQPGHQVLIQPMLQQVHCSGVVFSRVPSTGAHYLVINYDDASGSTSSVTAGDSNDVKTFLYFRQSPVPPPAWVAQVAKLVEDLAVFFQTDALDVEFAFTADGLHLLQVRPLAVAAGDVAGERRALQEVAEKITRFQGAHPHILGRKAVYGVMPDWNPAEIIGVRPRPLALSLYREIVTDNIWAYQRDNYGYRNVRSFPLMFSFAGLPYIDVRASFNSFLPAGLRDDLAERLVNEYVDRLIAHPQWHDKVEFEIVFTCYTLDLPERIQRLKAGGFSEAEIGEVLDSLRALTNRIINPDTGLWKKDIEKNNALKVRQERVLSSDLDPISKIYWLLEDCKRYGTLPFAGLARAAFIAVQFLRSLVKVGILSPQDQEDFLGSLNTVGSQLTRDFHQHTKEEFLKRYGHLRPGTYDLLSPRYDETPDRYFEWNRPKGAAPGSHRFALSIDQLKATEKMLAQHGLNYTAIGLFEFIKQAIEGREWSKFVFSRSLSESLSLIKQVGEPKQLSLDDLSYLDIHDLLELYHSSWNERDRLQESIARGRSLYQVTSRLSLPPLITAADDVWGFSLPKNDPNFVTQKRITGRVVRADAPTEQLRGSIVMIPSADPGYDWLFSHDIAGFITMYGGVNSHMAIRSAELGIPAVIGAGEALYTQWSQAECLELECLNRKVNILK